ncbi:adenosine deaminase [Allobranchiibius sp. GilTou73]|uniref:adenosine deaminase n=1 Tax=Allobranchiibius sp. GilTou73 TaxID=2904523 RepID=UPI001F351829|nr:adenosine deaminase [Allobranchiibius sp. GilTou73]UIJ36106.1 adenosine deaminase [Allobranchiibius sp. GilTou73]
MRSIARLPKAHLHLHFTGSLRVQTLHQLAAEHELRLPESFRGEWPPTLSAADERGWFRFQRLYDAARACVQEEADLRRLVREAVQDDAAEGSRWLEIQVDPTSYAGRLGGISPTLEIVLDEAATAGAQFGVGVGVIVAASRMRHPFEARTLARLAAKYAGTASGTVIGFGLSNDERRGDTSEFAPAFHIARSAGLASVPHAGELLGPQAVSETLDSLLPDRLGHGVRAVESTAVLDRALEAGVAFEVCPGSNVALGVYPDPADVPLRRLFDAGAQIALGADDPLLFGNRLVAQYASAREDHGFTDAELAELARRSLHVSRAPTELKRAALLDIDAWLAEPA